MTPQICCAGRALLDWTQRDLAARAHVAVSTVADYERGSRAPIANNIAAMAAALEAGGIVFVRDAAGEIVGVAYDL